MKLQDPWIDQRHFVHATRDTGYRGTGAAIAELVDNAVQAGARRVDILLLEHTRGEGRHVTIAVCDDGCGMSRSELQRSLQWGGSTRFDDRSGVGRYGMGLPNSSVSQARRVEVYSWRRGTNPIFTYLDVDEIVEGRLPAVPRPVSRKLPGWSPPVSDNGTLVVWSNCDRLDYKKTSTLHHKLERELGRIFRWIIWDGVALNINGKPVLGLDPLFLHREAAHAEAVQPVPPLIYEVRAPNGGTARVNVTFSLLPVEAWQSWSLEEKRERGITGGGGVSVLRARREIAAGWYFMDGKRKQNYDDWWRVEVAFDPALDELMGVTHSKQGIRPTKEIADVLAPDIGAVARALSTRVRNDFARLAAQRPAVSAKQATAKEWRLPRVAVRSNGGGTKASHLAYRIILADSGASAFFDWRLTGSELELIINKNHPFFRAIYQPVGDADLGWVAARLEMMLLAFARAEVTGRVKRPAPPRVLRTRWSDVLAAFLGD